MMMKTTLSCLIQNRQYHRTAFALTKYGLPYRVKIHPTSEIDMTRQEERERWYRSFLEKCRIDSKKIKTVYDDDCFVFQGKLLKDQVKRVPCMDGFISMKRIYLADMC